MVLHTTLDETPDPQGLALLKDTCDSTGHLIAREGNACRHVHYRLAAGSVVTAAALTVFLSGGIGTGITGGAIAHKAPCLKHSKMPWRP